MSKGKRKSKCEQEIPSSLWRTKAFHHHCDHVDSRTASNLKFFSMCLGIAMRVKFDTEILHLPDLQDLVLNLCVQRLKLF